MYDRRRALLDCMKRRDASRTMHKYRRTARKLRRRTQAEKKDTRDNANERPRRPSRETCCLAVSVPKRDSALSLPLPPLYPVPIRLFTPPFLSFCYLFPPFILSTPKCSSRRRSSKPSFNGDGTTRQLLKTAKSLVAGDINHDSRLLIFVIVLILSTHNSFFSFLAARVYALSKRSPLLPCQLSSQANENS